jgi:signal transduction histidine kinase
MDLTAIGSILLCSTLLGLATFVILHNRRAIVNRLFGLSVLSIVGWILSVSIALSSAPPGRMLFFARLGFAFAASIPFTLLWFFNAFASETVRSRRKHLVIAGVLCGAFILLSFSPLIVTSSTLQNDRLTLNYGPAHRFFGAYFLGCFVFAIYTLSTTIRSSSGLRRLQLRYLLLGIVLGGLGGTTTNLLIPLIWKTSSFSVLGPYFTLLMVSFSAHAIIRHRLMNIRLVVRRGIVYLVAVVVAGAVFVAALALLTIFLGIRRQDVPFATQVTIALAVALAFQPLKGQIQNWLDRYLYRESYNYPQIIRQASTKIGSTLELQPLLEYLCEVTGRTFRPDLITVFIKSRDDDAFRIAVRHSFGDTRDTTNLLRVEPDSPLPFFLSITHRPLLREELGRFVDGQLPQRAVAHLVELGGDFALPMLLESELLGFLVVGPKLSGDVYFAEDVELLATLTNQAAIAIKNAQLYRQVLLVNEYVENILRTMDSGVITVDSSGKVALSNSTAERLTGLSRSLLRSMTIDQLPRSLAVPLRATLLDSHSRSQIESVLAGEADRRTPIVSSTSALRDDRDDVVGALVVFSDLSKVKALESEKRRAERLAAFGALVSGIAHEIKNPLVAIRTFAELLPDRFSDTDFREDFSKVVITEIDRIDDLVGRLRGLAVPSLQQVAAVDIRGPITDTLALLRGKLEHTQTTVRRDFRDDSPMVSVDSDQLKQLFLNLLLNSIEAMGSGGKLTIRVRRRSTHNDSWICADVSDTGPGIPDALKSSIFDPFVTTKPRGSGLGLAICRGITDAHRGTIRAESAPKGTGAVIIVEFPAADQSADRLEHRTVAR